MAMNRELLLFLSLFRARMILHNRRWRTSCLLSGHPSCGQFAPAHLNSSQQQISDTFGSLPKKQRSPQTPPRSSACSSLSANKTTRILSWLAGFEMFTNVDNDDGHCFFLPTRNKKYFSLDLGPNNFLKLGKNFFMPQELHWLMVSWHHGHWRMPLLPHNATSARHWSTFSDAFTLTELCSMGERQESCSLIFKKCESNSSPSILGNYWTPISWGVREMIACPWHGCLAAHESTSWSHVCITVRDSHYTAHHHI